jgi:hypothetical protein
MYIFDVQIQLCIFPEHVDFDLWVVLTENWLLEGCTWGRAGRWVPFTPISSICSQFSTTFLELIRVSETSQSCISTHACMQVNL